MDFLSNGTPLTQAVVKEAEACAGITTEQVNRVVEQANTTAFQHLFEKKAGNKVITFDIAEPADVLSLLEGKVTPVAVKTAAAEYFRPADDYRSQRNKEAFDAQVDLEKTASASPGDNSLDIRTLLNSAAQVRQKAEKHASDQVDLIQALELRRQAIGLDFGKKVASFISEGGRFGEVVQAVAMRGGSDVPASSLLEWAAEPLQKLASARVVNQTELMADAAIYELQMEKTSAARQVDPSHPLVRTVDNYIKVVRKQAEAQEAGQKALELLRSAEAQYTQAQELARKR